MMSNIAVSMNSTIAPMRKIFGMLPRLVVIADVTIWEAASW